MNDNPEDGEEADDTADFIETCRVCSKPGDPGPDATFQNGGLVTIPVHTRCLAEWRQQLLTNRTTTPMNQQFQPRRPRPAANGRMKEQRHEDYAGDNGQPTLDQHAGGVARNLIKQTGVEDTTEIWRALKRAYLTGYADASR